MNMRSAILLAITGLQPLLAAPPAEPVGVPVYLGQRTSNVLVTERVTLPVVGPLAVAPLAPNAGMVSYAPVKPFFAEGEPVVLDLAVDLHGARDGALAPVLVRTEKGDFELQPQVSITPFSSAFPARFGVSTDTAPVQFRVQGSHEGVVFNDLQVLPADAPVAIKHVISTDGKVISLEVTGLKTPPLSVRDGLVHDATVVFVTKDGETDFLKFQWYYPKPVIRRPKGLPLLETLDHEPI